MKKAIAALSLVATVVSTPAMADNNDVLNGIIIGAVVGTIIHQSNQPQVVYSQSYPVYMAPRYHMDRHISHGQAQVAIMQHQARSINMCAHGDGRCAGMYYDMARGHRR